MPRARWTALPGLCLLVLFHASYLLDFANADCFYDDERFDENVEVATAEPCLNCTCTRGILLCYLRVCAQLPNPPPPGCILLHRFRTCCPELICTDIPGSGNGLEARSEPEGLDLISYDEKSDFANACIANGSIYGPGSAMDSSSLCEYCYCLGGKQTCVKPKCLLPIEGCAPLFEDNNCCPTHYNCTTLALSPPVSTTTMKPQLSGGCMIDGKFYPEGGKVLGIGHSVCDNCYCLRGILRCEPLSCAPPLLGCSPVIKSGECCAASYNCSGDIEIQPEPNYGKFPTISKEYSKLRKEVQNHKRPYSKTHPRKSAPTQTSNVPFYVIAESSPSLRSAETSGTTRHFTGLQMASTTSTTTQSLSDLDYRESLAQPDKNIFTRSYAESLVSEIINKTTDHAPENNPNSTELPSSSINVDTFNSTTQGESTTNWFPTEEFNSTTQENSETTFVSIDETTVLDFSTVPEDGTTIIDYTTTEESTIASTEPLETTTFLDSYENKSEPVTFKTVINTTDCSNSLQSKEVPQKLTTDSNAEGTTNNLKENVTRNVTVEDKTEVNLESRVRVGVQGIDKVIPNIVTILNGSKNKEQDYDYADVSSKPTLPPSLPNLYIQYFLPSDALDTKSENLKANKVFIQEKSDDDDTFGNPNLFSPPKETEGGFVPKDSPLLDQFYDTSVEVPSITTTKTNEGNCMSDGQEIIHGESVASNSPCSTCTCFYGNIVCQKAPCSPPKPNCRISTVQDLSLCCLVYVCDDEQPTVVLDRIDHSDKLPDLPDKITTPDPFRDVIRTESAPNLESLIDDMVPLLNRLSTTTPLSIATPEYLNKSNVSEIQITTTSSNNNASEDDYSFDRVWELLLGTGETSSEKSTTSTLVTTSQQNPEVSRNKSTISFDQTTTRNPNKTTDKIRTTESNNLPLQLKKIPVNSPKNSLHSDTDKSGILKLAGCNIYGRMYRVGKIISELSGPCLECKCSEVGVQCAALHC